MQTAPLADLASFALAGHAIFTVENVTSGNHFTYKVSACADTPALYFVGVLTGPENVSDYTYLGTIRNGAYQLGRKSRISADACSNKAFAWTWQHKDCLPACVHVYHAGRCGKCCRVLTVPESITRGIGPECAAKMVVA